MATFGCRPNVTTCDTLITGLRRTGNMNLTLKLHQEMVNGMGDFGGIYKPNVFCYGSLIDGLYKLCKKTKLVEANRLLELMMQRGLNPVIFTYTPLLNGYCLVGKVNVAIALFDSMARKGFMPDVFSYSVLINGYCKNFNVEEAMNVSREMILNGVKPTIATYNILLTDLFQAKKVGEV
ncbi:pentatricopeptide repeat-containing protein At5g39710-like [Citrus sinensis]|uniref:pentatricopeptide repeat-containing protein At5g39710-like n=1 Tax=Citrus sinensis TaxID=2711 RepID=UPI002279D82B|nr:pentatricopeptide repeat-containing protein At5g39710-like [Citrus sinensis]